MRLFHLQFEEQSDQTRCWSKIDCNSVKCSYSLAFIIEVKTHLPFFKHQNQKMSGFLMLLHKVHAFASRGRVSITNEIASLQVLFWFFCCFFSFPHTVITLYLKLLCHGVSNITEPLYHDMVVRSEKGREHSEVPSNTPNPGTHQQNCGASCGRWW